jgi:RNA polymerase sigma-70 factor (ECF subfamily)
LQDIPDADLIQRAQNNRGDPHAGAEAVGELYDRYQQAVFRYIWARIPNPQLAEDLTGEVFTRMLSNLPGYKITDAPFLAWLYAIARNLVSDHHRKNNKQDPLPIEQVETLPSQAPGPAESAENLLFIQQVQAALDDLNASRREVLILRFIVGLPLAEVAAILGKTTGAVKITQHRALATLRSSLDNHTGAHP